jgi:hypothetical protein
VKHNAVGRRRLGGQARLRQTIKQACRQAIIPLSAQAIVGGDLSLSKIDLQGWNRCVRLVADLICTRVAGDKGISPGTLVGRTQPSMRSIFAVGGLCVFPIYTAKYIMSVYLSKPT